MACWSPRPASILHRELVKDQLAEIEKERREFRDKSCDWYSFCFLYSLCTFCNRFSANIFCGIGHPHKWWPRTEDFRTCKETAVTVAALSSLSAPSPESGPDRFDCLSSKNSFSLPARRTTAPLSIDYPTPATLAQTNGHRPEIDVDRRPCCTQCGGTIADV